MPALAIKVIDGVIEVVSEGSWRHFPVGHSEANRG
jgi:hypothetical protein